MLKHFAQHGQMFKEFQDIQLSVKTFEKSKILPNYFMPY